MTVDNDEEIINSHIKFLYNSITSCKRSKEDADLDCRDDDEVEDHRIDTVSSNNHLDTTFRHPLKQLFKGLKKMVKKNKTTDDVEPLMSKKLFLHSSRWELLKSE